MTTIAKLIADIDALVTASQQKSDETIAALRVDNAQLRRQVNQLEGRIAEMHGRLMAAMNR